MQRANELRSDIENWSSIAQRVSDSIELIELDDDDLAAELNTEVEDIEKTLDALEFDLMLSGPRDGGNAILSLHAGAGGVDSQDFVAILLRMYLRWAEKRGLAVEIMDQSDGDVAGIKSVTLTVNGRNAYGYLKSEDGVHRLVRLSPFDTANRRHTSFAQVEILPEVEDAAEIEIAQKDIRMDVFRAAGAGGQHVQKNSTAVRITHIPSGIVVQCQNQRSQLQNRENAMKVLRSRLYEIQRQQREKELAAMRGDYVKAEWGSQIRSYVLHPYQMVKDHRTNYEQGNADAVLDGGLDNFIDAYLRAGVDGNL